MMSFWCIRSIQCIWYIHRPPFGEDVTPLNRSIAGGVWTCQNCALPSEWRIKFLLHRMTATMTCKRSQSHAESFSTLAWWRNTWTLYWLHHLDPSIHEARMSSRCHAQFATGPHRQCHLGSGPCTTSASRHERGLCLKLMRMVGDCSTVHTGFVDCFCWGKALASH